MQAEAERAKNPKAIIPDHRKSRAYLIGMSLFIIGNAANFASMAFAAQSMLSGLGAIQFVSNVIFASFVLNEKVTLRIVMGTCQIVGGIIVIVLFSNHDSPDRTAEDLLRLFRGKSYHIYTWVQVIHGVLAFMYYEYLNNHFPERKRVIGFM